MKFLKLTPHQVERFIAQLRGGRTWTNGLVGNETLSYQDGAFIREFRDMREPQVPPQRKTYDEEGIRKRLLEARFPPWVHGSLVRRPGHRRETK